MFLSLLAQATETFPEVTTTAADEAAAAAGVAVFGGFMLFAVIIGILSFAIWLWALIDVIKRQFPNPSDKNLWLILVIVGLFVGGLILPIIYLIVGRKKGTIPGQQSAS